MRPLIHDAIDSKPERGSRDQGRENYQQGDGLRSLHGSLV
jgi:hypothetical protein